MENSVLNPAERDKLLIEMHAIICDTEGHPGLCTDFRNLRKDYYGFKRWVIIIFVALLSSGVVSVGTIEGLRFFVK